MHTLDRLSGWLRINSRAFTGMVVAGILAIMIGAVLLVVAYVVINAITTGVLTGGVTLGTAGGSFNNSFWSTVANITQALSIAGIGLIIVGISMIVYTLMGFAGGAGRK